VIRLLTFSTLFPNSVRPNHGIFVENRLRHLVATGEAVSRVLAPVPWFPLRHTPVPAREERNGLLVEHPRYLAIPLVGMSVAPALLYLAARRALARMCAEGFAFDAIDAHYLYPDGVAAVWLGRAVGRVPWC
jgi:teichuronic acid biosynthesis glycosyltransferase TuaC